MPLFFLLSGYLLTGTEHRRILAGSYDVAAYLKRRFFRVAPAYYTIIIAASIGIAYCSYALVERPWLRGFPWAGTVRSPKHGPEPVI